MPKWSLFIVGALAALTVSCGPNQGGAAGVSVGTSPTPSPTAPIAGTEVQIPGVPWSSVNPGLALVTVQGDAPVVSQASAQAVAATWAQKLCGSTDFSDHIVLAHNENVESQVADPPGPLMWFFAVTSPTSFSSASFGGHAALNPSASPVSPSTPRPYTLPAHYCIISVDATTGQEAGFTLT